MTAFAEAALRRHRLVVAGLLAVLVALAWAWMFAGAGMGMDPAASIAAFPAGEGSMGAMMPSPSWTVGTLLLTFTMWWVMMAAMMLPSAAPTILLYAKVSATGAAELRPSSEAFLIGYLAAWGGFSLLATVAQALFDHTSLIGRMEMASQSRVLSSAILIAAGLYQLSPLKQACLRHCRSPAHFISRHFRPGWAGALRMGMLHGAFCLGCCWLLMTLLFVGGVMNLAWITFLTLLVAAEKLLPFGSNVAKVAGAGCIAWGIAILMG